MSYTSPVDVMLLLTRGHDVLLALRDGTGYADGQWNLPSGKLEAGEDAITAIIREAREEIGIRLRPEDLRLVATVHYRNPEGQARLGLFFHTGHEPHRHGEPINAEPHKCAQLDWFPVNTLPHNTVPYTAAGVDRYQRGEVFAVAGW